MSICKVPRLWPRPVAPLYQHLAQEPIKSRLPWDRVHFVLGDERFVPPDKILSGDTSFPASHIRALGEVIWFTDRAAAGHWA